MNKNKASFYYYVSHSILFHVLRENRCCAAVPSTKEDVSSLNKNMCFNGCFLISSQVFGWQHLIKRSEEKL